MFRRQVKLIALLGQPRQLLMRAEIVRRHCERFLPALDALPQWPVNILEGLFRGRVSVLANAVKNPARDGLLLGFITKKRVFQRHVLIGRIQTHGLAKLIPRGFVFSDLQQRVCQILVDRRPARHDRDRLLERHYRLVVILLAQRVVGALQSLISGIVRLARRYCHNQRQQ